MSAYLLLRATDIQNLRIYTEETIMTYYDFIINSAISTKLSSIMLYIIAYIAAWFKDELKVAAIY